MCERWRVDEAVDAIRICVSAECVDLCGQPCVHMYVVYRCVRAPAGSTRSALLLVGCRGTDLHQPHLCQAAGFGNL